MSAKFRTCRRCGEKTWDYDAEAGEWFCGDCDDWADL
jgi:transcription initiation factor TFIIIB Brf1 subunit/transcription initiation factor TFIIB